MNKVSSRGRVPQHPLPAAQGMDAHPATRSMARALSGRIRGWPWQSRKREPRCRGHVHPAALLAVAILSTLLCASFGATSARAGSAVVTDGRFTNIYVFPNPDKETWERHMDRVRPADAAKFSRAAIDRFTTALMRPAWPSYFDALYQYSGINPPQFFGSAVASQTCVDAALKDEHNGVLQWDTIRSLSNCHPDGMDPSPQVNLIFSPDIKIAKIVPFGTGGNMCTTSTTNAWHAWGLNTPNFAALPTSPACMRTFATFTRALSHEDVEMISDPAGLGMGTLGQNELADNCQNRSDGFTTWDGYAVARYWSNFDQNCQPRLNPPADSTSETWVLGEASPLQRFTGDVHLLDLSVPRARRVTDARLTRAVIVIQTGGDDLRGGGNPGDNADVTLRFVGGSTTTVNVNAGRNWENGETHAVQLLLPAPSPRVSDLTGVRIATNFGGGLSGDNWNVDKVALLVSFDAGAKTTGPEPQVVHTWLNASSNPLVRFTGDVHDFAERVPRHDVGREVSALTLTILTGNDDLRGGSNPGDNCDVTVGLASGATIWLPNVNHGQSWTNWSSHTVAIPLPRGGLKGGDVATITLHTGFGGGLSGDNWNVNQILLKATLQN